MNLAHDEKDAKGELLPLPKPFRAQGQQIASDRDVRAFCDLWERGQVLAFSKACVDVAVAEAVAREREACAKEAESCRETTDPYDGWAAVEDCAFAIRARSAQPDAGEKG